MKSFLFELPELGYPLNALAPMMSQETLSCHYGKHFHTYVNNLNQLVPGSRFEGLALEDVIRKAPIGPILNNAGQVYNHLMFFEQFRPTKEGKHPSGELLFLLEQSFGSAEAMREQFDKAALSLFGSGWVWLAMNKEGKLEIMPLANADTPLRYQMKPLLTIDMWEHAYYLDYQNRKADYIKNFWMLINWHMISSRING